MRGLCLILGLSLSVPIWAGDLSAGIAAIERRDYAAALKQFRPFAASGDVVAQLNLGNLYMKGLGVKQDYAEALRWFHLAADQNEPMAWAKLGVMHFYGLGVDKNPEAAAEWFRKAAERGDPGAQTVLASMYAEGDGVRRDRVTAYYWYSLAADQGNEDAKAGRDSLEEEISPGDKDEALRLVAETRKKTGEWDESPRSERDENKSEAPSAEDGMADAEPRPASRKSGKKSGGGKHVHKRKKPRNTR